MRRGAASGAAAPAVALVVAGGAQALSLAWPGSGQPLWWLQIVSLAGFAWLLRRAPGALAAALRGWLFATAWLVGTFWWLFISMHTYGGLAAPLAALAVLGLAAFLGAYYAIASWCFWALRPKGRALQAIVFAALWLLAELARGVLWTGFPWGAGGYAHTDGPLAALARWVGVYGVGALAAALAMALAQVRPADVLRARAWLSVGALALVLWGAADVRERALAQEPASPPLGVALLQGNIPQDEKFQPGSGVPLALRWYGQELRAAQAQLVVAPETAIPLLPQQLEPGYLEQLRSRYSALDGTQAALVGIPLGSFTQGYTNSVLGWVPGAIEPYRYDKHHLVPFGEFIPPLFKWFTEMMDIPLGDFRRGGLGQAPMAWAGERIAPNICYEDLFGEELGARFADPQQAPTMFVNLSNIGWFGDSIAIDQHLAISRMRALEFERPMVRATNTGATALIDHRGQVTQRLPAHTRGVLLGEVQGRTGLTPFAVWVARAGLAPLWGLGLAVVALAWRRRRR
ncbi:apolipoprotein N-acyltransferase [Paenacidovorax caeni]|uniref:Apolipoprotein N-acyltransferase n=1 Tax=Paenacidovorax caeni TaxID=343013 RepID=A0A1I7GQM6_9BURK|nr:apolipoprotein N-acyltransferase [Paenacidovorax caeni]SFU50737.1 apolipoprotein N-acyltransferase [Paenacidovorax caeni]